ncbi:MAG: acetyl-CoA acetyltransferase [Deltaproteobacteria bacterium HGW-Deltaproteobacteria-15]|jgi:acetyl-CoA C-acetyltransferase|nr:MAG: acetyl-CoA acetyltransferase [Deltaproteobacteria bacterium HGW-Deltaproteobacteria-15]
MGTIKDKVAIIGMGCTKFGELWDKGVDDLIIEATFEACEDAGVDLKDIEAAWLGTVFSGQTALSLSSPLKLQYIPVTRVENMCATGTEALRGAAYAVAAGVCDIALAVGAEKLKDTGWTGVQPANVVGRTAMGTAGTELELSPPGLFALLASGYFHRHGLDAEKGKRLLAQIAVKNHHNGSLNPKAHFQNEITIEQVLKAPIVAAPLGILDCCGVSDGAAAAIVTRADLAKKFRKDPIYIKSMAIAAGPGRDPITTKYDFAHVEENVRASRLAYREAGIKEPRRELSIAEVHDCFTIHEMCVYEDLGWSGRGRAKDDIEAGTFQLKGELPVNTDGGLKCFGHPLGASGLRMQYEVYKQLQEKAGPRQVNNPRLGLTHNLGGTVWGGVACICITGNELDRN